MTISKHARNNTITPEMKLVSECENVSAEFVRAGVAAGTIVIPKNNKRSLKKLCGVGQGLKTKVNANLGTSPDHVSIEEEMIKLDAAVRAGADAVMDLSTGGDLKKIRRAILDNSPVPLGTVPIYQAACETRAKGKPITEISADHLFDVIEEQLSEGVDFLTVHCGITRETVTILDRQNRLVGVVSRGGAQMVRWIKANGKENPLY